MRRRSPARATVGLGVALASGLVAAIVAYATLRAGQVLFQREPHPRDVVLVGPSGYVWRVWAAAFAGAVAVTPAWLAGRSSEPAAARALALAIPVAAVLLLAQAVFAP